MAASPEPEENCMVPEEHDLQDAICRLTSTEKDIINSVLQRDEEVRSQEKDRLRQLKRELDELQELGVPEGKEKEYGRVCMRCRSPLGAIANRGGMCPWCNKKVCKNCQKPLGNRWICTMCNKEREIKGESGEWFYGSLPKKKKIQYGSTLLKKLIRRRKSQAYKLSKSRQKSEDDSLTSCEIEWAISETFKKGDRSDHEYVVVDQDKNGAVSVSEGNVANIHHFGSEAGGLCSVSEEKENEAALRDVAFTSNLFQDFDYDRETATVHEMNEAAVYKRDAATVSADDLAQVSVTAHRTDEDTGERRDTLVKLSVAANPFLDDDYDDDAKKDELQQSSVSFPVQTENEEKEESNDRSSLEEAIHIGTMPQKPVRGLYRSSEDLMAENIELSLEPPRKDGLRPLDNDIDERASDVLVKPPHEEEVEKSQEDIARDFPVVVSNETNIEHDMGSDEFDKETNDTEIVKETHQRKNEEAAPLARQISASKSSESEHDHDGDDDDDEGEHVVEKERNRDVDDRDTEHAKFSEESCVGDAIGAEAEDKIEVSLDLGTRSRLQPISIHNDDDSQRKQTLEVESSYQALGREMISIEAPDEVKYVVEEGNEDDCGFGKNLGEEDLRVTPECEQADEESQGSGEHTREVVEEREGEEEEIVDRIQSVDATVPLEKEIDKTEAGEGVIEQRQNEGVPMSVKERIAMYKEKEKSCCKSSSVLISMGNTSHGKYDTVTKESETTGDLTCAGIQEDSGDLQEKTLDATETVKIISEGHHHEVELDEPRASEDLESPAYEKVNELDLLLEAENAPGLGRTDVSIEDDSAIDSANEHIVDDINEVVDRPALSEVIGIEEFADVNEQKEARLALEENVIGSPMSSIDENQLNASEDHYFIKENSSEGNGYDKSIGSKDSEVNMLDEGQSADVIRSQNVEGNVSSDMKNEVSFNADIPSTTTLDGEERPLPDELYAESIPVFEGTESTLSVKDLPHAASYESLNSYQSDEGDMYEALRPHVKVAGEIVLGLKYDAEAQRLEVQIHRANGLLAADSKKNTSDPYVKTYLDINGTRAHKKKTKVKKHTLDPVFDEIITYKTEYEALLDTTLVVSVWHNDMFGQNIFLGESEIKISSFIASGFSLDDPTPQQYQLTNKRANRSSLIDVGEIVMEIMYVAPGGSKSSTSSRYGKHDPVSGQLFVKLIECRNLNGTESSNPFCELRLLPWKSGTKEQRYTSEIEAKTLNPYWDKEFTLENVTFNELSKKVLEVKVLDASVGKKAGFLGAVRLGNGQTEEPFDDPSSKEHAGWQKMLQEPNKRIPLTLPLRSKLESLKSSAILPPILVEREEEIPFQVRDKKSDSILSQSSVGSHDDASSLRASLSRTKLKPQPDQFSLQSFGSMLSIYSDAGGYGSVPVSGEILFSIQYDNIAGVFEVHVQKAKNIAAVNKKTRASDPYVKTYLLPDKSKESKKKTNFRRKTVNPEWNEKIKYKIGEKDLLKRTLQVSVWNHEKFGQNDFLGEAQVRISQYVKSGHNLIFHEPIWYTLQQAAPVSVGESGYKGSITIGLKYEKIDESVGKLLVDIKGANDLAAADPTQLSNPFVKAYLLPDKTRKSKRKSTFKKGTLSPTWNEKFEYNGITLEELEQRVLELTVWDHDLRSNDFLGGTRLGLGRGDENWHDCIGKEASIWNAMLEHPGIWVEYNIPLRDSMTSRKGMEFSPPEIDSEKESSEPVPIAQPTVSESSVRDEPVGPIVKTGDNVKSKINIELSEPLIRVGLMFVSEEAEGGSKKKGTLRVMLKQARNLPSISSEGSPNTYCKCYMRPRRNAWRFKTGIFKRSVEPTWNAEFAFESVSLEELDAKCLDIIIYNDDNEGIGMARLGPGIMQQEWDDSKEREVELWVAMIENPDSWNFLMIPLRMQIDEASSLTDNEVESVVEKIQSNEVVPKVPEPSKEKKMSAKELALQSMGTHATKVIDLMENDTQETKKATPKAPSRSQDALPRTLSLIREEEDGDEQRVKFADSKAPASARKKTAPVIPKVVISEEDENTEALREIPDAQVDIDAEDNEMPSNLQKMKRFGSRDSIASMTSIYSTMSNSVTGMVPVRGQIQFCTKYIRASSMFEVHIFKAKDIAAVDAKKEISDPYVKVYLLPDKSKASKRKTKVKQKTLNPQWNEIISYKISLVDLRLRTLMVSIWNFDRLGRNIFLGEVLIPMDEKTDKGLLNESFAEWYDLQDQKTVKSPVIFKGKLTVSLMFETNMYSKKDQAKKEKEKKKGKEKEKKKKQGKGRILIHVIRGEDLPAADADGLSDPYCKFYLLPGKASKTKRKTPVIRKTRSAFWDYHTEYDVEYDDLPEMGIEFTVYDYDQSSRNDFLGCARLNLGGRTTNGMMRWV
ncbi:uncharacterized protein LOC135685055 isoform X2 [Rhopilema esculentum]|uniref:uncharacterized protein LOC135685055 isoform X2 n=1 Tax=Rhopilema esculentum TaxID=499914 RepID=UPI0031DE39AD